MCVSQRRDIVTGTVEPTDEECEWHSDREEEEELAVSTALICLSLEPEHKFFFWFSTAKEKRFYLQPHRPPQPHKLYQSLQKLSRIYSGVVDLYHVIKLSKCHYRVN